MEFCLNCGGTVTWTAEALPGLRAIAGGSFDDPNGSSPSVFLDAVGPPLGDRARLAWSVFQQGTLPRGNNEPLIALSV